MTQRLFILYIYTIFSLNTVALWGGSAQGKYPIQNFAPQDYRGGNQNIDFAQNRNQQLFVANNLGILSYNGFNWQTHALMTGKKKRSLAFDEYTDRLYVGSQADFGFFSDDWVYTSLLDLVPDEERYFDEVWDVFIFNSHVYFCTFYAIYVYDHQSHQINILKNETGLQRSFVTDTKLFTQSQDGTLYIVEQDRLVTTFPQLQNKQTIAGIIPKDDGYLIFYNSGQIVYTNSFHTQSQYKEISNLLEGSYVNHVLQLADTRLVIATQTAGVYIIDLIKQDIDQLSTKDGLLTNACLRTYQDADGNLWVGLQNGIALIHLNSPLRFSNRESLIQGSGYAAYSTPRGMYYTTSNGIYWMPTDKSVSIFVEGTEGPAYSLQKIGGKLYAGHHTGLYILNDGKADLIAHTEGLWQVKLLQSNPQYAIGGTYSGLFLFKMDNEFRLQPVSKIAGFNESSRFFEEDKNGNLWVGQYYKGLYYLTLENDLKSVSAQKISENNSLPIKEQIILTKVNNDLYLATHKGLFQIDQQTNKIQKAPYFDAIIGEQPVYLFEQDAKNNIYLIAENMVGYFRHISNQNFIFKTSSLGQMRYYLNNDLLNMSKEIPDGVMFSANSGFIYYNPDLEADSDFQKPLVLSKVVSISQDKTIFQLKPFAKLPPDDITLILSQQAKVLQFHVESFQFNDLSNQQYRFQLKNFETNFGEWREARVKEYTNLKEGDYELIAQTRNNLGEIKSSQPVYITIKPPFYRSIWAKITYFLLSILALFTIFINQKRRYQQKEIELQAKKQKELAEKQKKLQEIEQIRKNEREFDRLNIQHLKEEKEKDLLLLKNQNIQNDLRNTTNLLAASTMYLVKKNEFLYTVRKSVASLLKKHNSKPLAADINKIVHEIDNSISLEQDWQQFEMHFDKVHGDFLDRIRQTYDLSPTEQKLCAYLRLNLSTKEIANLMSVSNRGVEIARYRLRMKLNLQKGQNLAKFILEF